MKKKREIISRLHWSKQKFGEAKGFVHGLMAGKQRNQEEVPDLLGSGPNP